MKLKSSNIRKVLFGCVLMLPALMIVYTEFVEKEAIVDNSVDVVVLKSHAKKNTKITSTSMLTTQKVSLKDLEGIGNYVTKPESIVGLETVNFVPKNSTLVNEYFVEPKINLKEGEFVFSLPTEWVYSFPQTVRRLDDVYLYPIKCEDVSEGFSVPNTVVPTAKHIYNTTVFYVKDSSNREVQDAGTSKRYDGTATASNLELKVTEDKLKLLKDYYMSGYKFIISYK